MSYTSYQYLLLFLGAVFLGYTAMPKKYKWTVLLAASYVFYFLNSGKLAIYLLLTTIVVYFAGLFINHIQDGFKLAKKSLEKEDKKTFKANIAWQKRAVVVIALIIIFGLLLFLKYHNFFGGIINSVLRIVHVKPVFKWFHLALPLGISYYTLQAASYIIDVYRGKYRASTNFGKVALFLSFFPQMVEGPIGRFDLLADPLYEGHKFNYDNFTQGIQLIFWGLFKKFIIADRANILVANVFKDYKDYSGSIILVAGILYTIQIYAEFSGCMDIVTGSAQLFSVPLSSNFNRPFFSKTVGEFWRRWHITLGAWLRDYIFYSISLSKVFMNLSKFTKKHFNEFLGSMVPASFALFFTWFGIGFWHGAGWKYIIYGMYYYVILMLGMYLEPIIAKVFSHSPIKRQSTGYQLFQMIRTTCLVIIGMIMFRATNIGEWIYMMKAIFTNFHASDISSGALLTLGINLQDFIAIAGATLVVFIVSLIGERGIDIRTKLASSNIVLRWVVYLALILSVIIFGAYGPGYTKVDFIYGQF